MPNPWDRPPTPARGDDEDTIYASVGRFVTRWELLEMELADLFAMFIGVRYHDSAYAQYYDQGKTTQGRLATIEMAAQGYFQRTPNQALEGDFCGLMRATKGFSQRRHEIAHGVVRPWEWFAPRENYEGPRQFCLIPPSYQVHWLTERAPGYFYTAPEINMFSAGVCAVWSDLCQFKNRISGGT